MKRIENTDDVVQVVKKGQTIADQIVAAPIGSVTIVHFPSSFEKKYGPAGPRYSDALVKTGSDGYKAAYYGHEGFLHANTVQRWVDAYPHGEFYLIEGPQA